MKVNIIGYGNQAKVWANNLRDSGVKSNILLREKSSNITQAKQDGFDVETILSNFKNIKQLDENAKTNELKNMVFCLLIPDEEHSNFFNK